MDIEEKKSIVEEWNWWCIVIYGLSLHYSYYGHMALFCQKKYNRNGDDGRQWQQPVRGGAVGAGLLQGEGEVAAHPKPHLLLGSALHWDLFGRWGTEEITPCVGSSLSQGSTYCQIRPSPTRLRWIAHLRYLSHHGLPLSKVQTRRPLRSGHPPTGTSLPI